MTHLQRQLESLAISEDEMDHLTELPEDCLLDILSRTDHDDLDAVATLSEKMRNLAASSRSRAVKTFANALCIVQSDPHKYVFSIYSRDHSYYVEMDATAALPMTLKRGRFAALAREYAEVVRPANVDGRKVKAGTKEIVDRATSLLFRFDFNKCKIRSVVIDAHLLTLLEHIASTRSLTAFSMHDSVFDVKTRVDGFQRFSAMLLLAKPANLELWCNGDIPSINETFISDYAHITAPFPCLQFNTEETSTLLRPERNFADILPEFGTLCVYHLVIPTEWIVPALFRRRSHNIDDKWEFLITRNLGDADLRPLLEPNLRSAVTADGNHCWSSDGQPNAAKISVIITGRDEDEHTLWKLRIHFN